MKCFLALALLLLAASAAFPQDDPGTQYVDAFLLTQEGDAAKGKSDWKTAYKKFSAAQNILLAIKQTYPNWNVHLVQFRLDHCSEQLAAIKPHLPPSPTVAPQPSTTATGRSELDKLRTELAEARAEIERAKATKLSAQARLAQKDADEAERMAEANQKIADLQKQLTDLNRQLDEINTLRANLATANKALAQLDELRKANANLQTQLAGARRIAATTSGDLQKLRTELTETRATTDRTSQQHAAELDQLKKENQALTDQLADAKRANVVPPHIVAELQTLRDELAAARATNVNSASQIEALQQERQNLLERIAAINSSSAATPENASRPASNQELQRQNRDLNERLASATRQLNVLRRHVADDASDNAALTHKLDVELSKLKAQNKELQRQLSIAQATASKPSVATRSPVTHSDSAHSDTTRSALTPIDVTRSDGNRGVLKARRQTVTSPLLSDAKDGAARNEGSLDGKTVVLEGKWNGRAKQEGQIICESEPRVIDVFNIGERSRPEDGQKVRITATLHWHKAPPGADKDSQGRSAQVPPAGYLIDWAEARWERIQDK